MDTGRIVVVSCAAPKEKFWGLLLSLEAVGATVRGLPVEAFEDWLRPFIAGSPHLIGAVTLFLPLHRIERIEVDESSGAVEGLADRFTRLTGRDPRRELVGQAEVEATREREM